MSRVIIIGGGASGLVAAIYAAQTNDVVLLEKNSKCGKKLLITGNGKCNYWNEDFNVSHFNSSNLDLLKKIISADNKNKILRFFDEIGIVPRIKNGYYYPMSNQAISIQTALLKQAKLSKVVIKTESEVIDVKYQDKYQVKTKDETYECEKLIISTGSMAAPNTGSTGDGYRILSKFNHSLIKPTPALVQLISKGSFLKKWSGIRCDAKLSLYEDNCLIKQSLGEIQLTDYGISGVCTFQLSGLVSRGLSLQKKETIEINFLPWLKEDFINYMDMRNSKVKSRMISELLDSFFNYKLVNIILELSGIKQDELWENISLEKKNKLKFNLTCFKLQIVDTKGFEHSQTCTGGIPLSEINLNTMESKKSKNLFITGELLDADGQCGGYNLGFAFITGMLAGSGVND